MGEGDLDRDIEQVVLSEGESEGESRGDVKRVVLVAGGSSKLSKVLELDVLVALG